MLMRPAPESAAPPRQNRPASPVARGEEVEDGDEREEPGDRKRPIVDGYRKDDAEDDRGGRPADAFANEGKRQRREQVRDQSRCDVAGVDRHLGHRHEAEHESPGQRPVGPLEHAPRGPARLCEQVGQVVDRIAGRCAHAVILAPISSIVVVGERDFASHPRG
jgi:hypothetical protein